MDTPLAGRSVRPYVQRTVSGIPIVMAAGRTNRELEAATPTDSRNARLYLVGLGCSLIGNSAMSLVAGIWVKSLTGSSAEAGLVSVCIYAPSLLGPVAGLVVDHVERRRWLFWVNVGSGILLLSLIRVAGPGDTWLIYTVMGGYGLGLILIGPAEDALFAEMLPLALRQRMNSWRLAIQETGRLIAPLLGAGVFAVLGGGLVSALDALSFIVAAAVISLLSLAAAGPRVRAQGWRSDIVDGWWHIRGTLELRKLVIAATLIMAISGLGVAAQYSLVDAIAKPPSFLGVLAAALGAGSIVASLSSRRFLARWSERHLALAGLVNFATGTVLRASGWLPAAIFGSAVLGFALPWIYLAVLSAAQRLTPNQLQGRVSAAVALALFAPQAPTQAVGSLAIRYLTYREVYMSSALIAVLLACYLALWGRHSAQTVVSRIE